MTEKEEALLKAIRDIMMFALLIFAMFYAKDLIRVVQYGFMLIAMTILNRK